MAKVEEEVSTADQRAGADDAARWPGTPAPRCRHPARRAISSVRFWRSAVGKKWVMAVSGIVLLGYVLAHMVGNLKVFLGKEHINVYGEWLRDARRACPAADGLLWGMRIVLIARVRRPHHRGLPAHADEPPRPPGEVPVERDYAAANFASRTMRWTGVIVALFVVFHLLDLTWGSANPDFVRGDPYDNIFDSFERVPGRDRLHRRHARAGLPHLPRGVEHVPEPRAQQPALEHLAALVRGRVRRS